MSKINCQTVKHICFIRTDNIGDAVLTIPALGILKQLCPKTKITFMGRSYIQAVMEACPYVDDFFSVDQLKTESAKTQIDIVRSKSFDVVIHMFSNKILARLFKAAKVRHRVGSINRCYSFLTCNHFINAFRSEAVPHEAQKAVRYLKPFGYKGKNQLTNLKPYVVLNPSGILPQRIAKVLEADKFNLIIHPGSNGHTKEWSVSQFQALIKILPKDKYNILLTGSPTEKIRFQADFENNNVQNIMGETTLDELMLLISKVDGLIAGSTGTLHMAAACGIITIGLFPSRFFVGPKVWAALGKQALSLSYSETNCRVKCKNGDCACMRKLQVSRVVAALQSFELKARNSIE